MSAPGQKYCGRLYYLESGQLCLDWPLMFFHADGAGGWTRLETRLKLNGLKLKGAKVPTNPSDVPGAVADHAEVCVSEGALHLVVPQASIPFKTLIKRLEEKGILKPSAASKKLAKDPEPALTAAFHSEVRKVLSKEESSSVEEEPVVTPSGNPTDLDQVEVYIDPTPHHSNDTPPVETGVPAPPALHVAADPQAGQDRIPADHVEYMRQLELQNASLKNTINQLEMQNATDRTSMAVDLQEMISTAVDHSIEKVRLTLASDVSSEIKAKINSHTDRLISELGTLTGNKTKLESCNTDLAIIKETLEEVLDATNTSNREITAQLTTILDAGCALSGTSESISAIKTQLSAITALLKEALKNAGASTSALVTPNKPILGPLSLTPGPTPPNFPKLAKPCDYCGSTSGHEKRDCPKKLEFCPRCYRTDHRAFECELRDLCSICSQQGLGDMAFGHTRRLHFETDRSRREHIMRFVGRDCFPDWTGGKRKNSGM